MPEGARDGRSSSPRKAPESLRNSALYREIYRTGTRYRGSAIKAVYRSNALGGVRLGFSVSRKTGNAVKRNLFKRRIRTMTREKGAGLSVDMIFSPVGRLEKATWYSLRNDFLSLMKLLGRS
jgi:ribonuclease P protein component